MTLWRVRVACRVYECHSHDASGCQQSHHGHLWILVLGIGSHDAGMGVSTSASVSGFVCEEWEEKFPYVMLGATDVKCTIFL